MNVPRSVLPKVCASSEVYGESKADLLGGPLRRYAQRAFPKSQMFLEYAKRLAGAR